MCGQRIFLFFALVSVAFAGITNVVDNVIIGASSSLEMKSSVYALKDSPIGIDTPQISFQLTFQQASGVPANVTNPIYPQVLLFHSSRWYEVGVREGLRSQLCCTSKLFDQGSCFTPGFTVFHVSDNPDRNGQTLYNLSIPITAENKAFTTNFRDIVPANSGVWYVILANCDPLGRAYSFKGSITFKSPFGYIPGQSFPHMVVYFTVGGLFMVLLGFWVVWLFRYRINLQFYQYGITLLIMTCVAEEIFWGWEYVNYNNYGLPTMSVLVPAVVITAAKLCWTRVLLLLMGLGFRIITPFLSLFTTIGIIFLTAFYFAVTVAEAYLNVDDLFGIQIIPLATWVNKGFLMTLNVVYFVWILGTTVSSMTTCKNEKQNLKYTMYQRNIIVFGTITVTSVIFYFIEIGITASYVADASWRSNWLLRTYWDFIYLATVTFFCYIWRPATDNNRFAYGAQVLRDDTGLSMPQVKKSASGKKSKKKSKKSRIAPPREVTLDDDSSESSSE